MIATATWRTDVYGCNHGPGLFRIKVCDGSVNRPFRLNRGYAPELAGAWYVVSQKVLHEAANRRQTTVPRHGGVAALGFDVAQEGEHGLGLDVVEIEILDCFSFLTRQEQEEHFSASR